MNKKPITAQDHRLVSYPKPSIYSDAIAYSKMTGESRSDVVEKALAKMFNELPPEEKERMKMHSKNSY